MKPVFSKYTERNIEQICNLDPAVRELFMEFLLRIAEEGIYIRIPDYGAKRTSREQQYLYDKRPRVTWVLCPFSWHCHGLAVDLVPLMRLGPIYYKALWRRVAPYETMARVARELNIEWGFNKWGMDKGHFHYAGGKNIDQVSKCKYPNKPSFKKKEYHRETMRMLARLQATNIISQSHFPYLYHGTSIS